MAGLVTSLPSRTGARRVLLAVWLVVAIVTLLERMVALSPALAAWLAFALLTVALPTFFLEPSEHQARRPWKRPFLALWIFTLLTCYHALEIQSPAVYDAMSAVTLVLLSFVVMAVLWEWVRRRIID